jgi:hypothetical protein
MLMFNIHHVMCWGWAEMTWSKQLHEKSGPIYVPAGLRVPNYRSGEWSDDLVDQGQQLQQLITLDNHSPHSSTQNHRCEQLLAGWEQEQLQNNEGTATPPPDQQQRNHKTTGDDGVKEQQRNNEKAKQTTKGPRDVEWRLLGRW